MALLDSYSEANSNAQYSLYNGYWMGVSQSFTGDGNVLDSCKFYSFRIGSPTGNAVARIYTHTGTYGTSSEPTDVGSPLATSDNLAVSTISTSDTLVTLTFSGANRITLANGTYYCIAFEYVGGDADNHIHCWADSTTPSHGGNLAATYGSISYFGGNDVNKDCIFYVYNDVGLTTTSTSTTTISTSSTSTSRSTSSTSATTISTSSTSHTTSSTSTSHTTSSTSISTSTTSISTTSTSSSTTSTSISTTTIFYHPTLKGISNDIPKINVSYI